MGAPRARRLIMPAKELMAARSGFDLPLPISSRGITLSPSDVTLPFRALTLNRGLATLGQGKHQNKARVEYLTIRRLGGVEVCFSSGSRLSNHSRSTDAGGVFHERLLLILAVCLGTAGLPGSRPRTS